MHCLACTSPKYRHLDKGFLYLWEKYLGLPVEIFETEQDHWRGSISRKIDTIQDDTVLMILTDYWLTAPTDFQRLERARTLLEANMAQKVDLQAQANFWAHIDHDDMVEATQTAQYRQSTQAAIYRRQYLADCFRQGSENPWQWELAPWSQNDGAKILGWKTPVIRYADVMMKGQPHGFMLCHLSDQDLAELDGIGALAGLMDPTTIRAHGSA